MTEIYLDHPGMITSDEEELIGNIIRNDLKNSCPCFVEVGPWLGKSTYCILDSISTTYEHIDVDSRPLICFDRFKWSDMYSDSVRNYSEFASRYGIDKLKDGDCFQVEFDNIMADHSSKIAVVSSKKEVSEISLGDITSFAANRHVSAFFIDASKNWEYNYSLLGTISRYLSQAPGKSIIYLQDALHPTAYRLLSLIVLSEGFEWHRLSLNTGTAVSIMAGNNFRLPSFQMDDYDVSQLFSSWHEFKRFLGEHHLSEMSSLALVSFLIFTGHSDAAKSVGIQTLSGMDKSSIQIFERLVGNKVLKQYRSIGIL